MIMIATKDGRPAEYECTTGVRLSVQTLAASIFQLFRKNNNVELEETLPFDAICISITRALELDSMFRGGTFLD